VTGREHDLVQFVSALLRLGAEGQLFEHVRLLSAPPGPTRVRAGLLDKMAGNRRPPCKANAGRIGEDLCTLLSSERVGACREYSFRRCPLQNCG
jgi:hypothetical protein